MLDAVKYLTLPPAVASEISLGLRSYLPVLEKISNTPVYPKWCWVLMLETLLNYCFTFCCVAVSLPVSGPLFLFGFKLSVSPKCIISYRTENSSVLFELFLPYL